MTNEKRPCPNCLSENFVDGKCARCGRPRFEDAAYLDKVETLAWATVNATYDHFGDLRGTAPSGPELQRAILRLADRLRHYHYDGDGCLDDDESAITSSILNLPSPSDESTVQLYLRDLGQLIVNLARNAKLDRDRSVGGEDEDVSLGRLMAFHEIVSLMQQQAVAFGLDLHDLSLAGLDPNGDLL